MIKKRVLEIIRCRMEGSMKGGGSMGSNMAWEAFTLKTVSNNFIF